MLVLALSACGGSASQTGAELPRREITPACRNPAPLSGVFDTLLQQQIVLFADSVDATAEAARLASRYGFVTVRVYASGLKGFVAKLSPTVLASVRCEVTVVAVEQDARVTTQ